MTDSLLTKKTLFHSRFGGYHTFRIPCLVKSPADILIAVVEARHGNGGDWDSSDLVLRRSIDNGNTWEEPTILASNSTFGPGPLHNLVMIVETINSRVHFVFCHNYEKVFYTRTDDDGETFTPPREITRTFHLFLKYYPWRVLACGPGHSIQLTSGRLLIPIWLSDGCGIEFGPGKLGHRPSVVATIYSDDHGESWHPGEIMMRDGDLSADGSLIINPSESVIIELPDGRLMMNSRNESPVHRRLVCVSPDGISRWTTPSFDPYLFEPVCMASLVRHPQGPLVFVNPFNLEQSTVQSGVACDRVNLAVQVSDDAGETWRLRHVIEPGPSAYSDLTVLSDGSIACLFESGKLEHMGDTKEIVFTRFDI